MRTAKWVAGWLATVCLVTLFGVALPLPARIAICIGVATFGAAGIRTCFLLTGRHSVRALRWEPSGSLLALCGPRRIEKTVEVVAGSFRLGDFGWLLWLRGCDGSRAVFIDAGIQDICALRRLARHLEWARDGKLIPSEPKV